MVKLKIRCWGGGLVHCANNIWTIKKQTNKQIIIVNFEKQLFSKISTFKSVIQTSFVKKIFVATNDQILCWESDFWEHQILKAKQESQSRKLSQKMGF